MHASLPPRDRLGESSVNPSAGSRARRKPTRFRRTISWWDLSRPSTKGLAPIPRHECINEREREGYSCHEFPLTSVRVQPETCPNPSSVASPRKYSRYLVPLSVSGIGSAEISYSGRRKLVGIDQIWEEEERRREKKGTESRAKVGWRR